MKNILTMLFVTVTIVTFSQTIINVSFVSGNWTLSGSPYIVQNDITLLTGQSLSVESGVTVKFEPETNFMVNGVLIADGVTFEASDTNQWHDESTTQGGWNGIHFMPITGTDSSVFNNNIIRDCKFGYPSAVLYSNAFTCNRSLDITNCLFEHNTSGTGFYVSEGIVMLATQDPSDTIFFDKCTVKENISVFGIIRTMNYWDGQTTISNSRIFDNSVGSAISGTWNNLIIENNEIYQNVSQLDNSAVKLSMGNVVVKSNKIHHNECEQLATVGCRSGQITIENNLICNNYQTNPDCGLLAGGGAIHLAHNEGSVPFSDTYYIVRNNVIANNRSEYGGGAIYVYKAKTTVSNNQIVNNTAVNGNEILINDPLSDVYMKNNLFFGVNDSLDFIRVESANNIEFDYNFIQSNYTGSFLIYSAFNLVGDTTHNVIGSDPMIVDPTTDNLYTTNAVLKNFNVFPTSPCINAGDTAYAYTSTIDYLNNDRIVDIIDIGAFEYQNDVNLPDLKQQLMKFEVYPNPAQLGSIISIQTSETTGNIVIYDIQGKPVKTLTTYSSSVTCDLSGLASGVYFIHKEGYIPTKLIIR